MDYHDSHRHSWINGANDPDTLQSFETMSLKQLQTVIDAEILADTVADIMSLPAAKRTAAIADFAEIDPELGAKLHLAVSFALS